MCVVAERDSERISSRIAQCENRNPDIQRIKAAVLLIGMGIRRLESDGFYSLLCFMISRRCPILSSSPVS